MLSEAAEGGNTEPDAREALIERECDIVLREADYEPAAAAEKHVFFPVVFLGYRRCVRFPVVALDGDLPLMTEDREVSPITFTPTEASGLPSSRDELLRHGGNARLAERALHDILRRRHVVELEYVPGDQEPAYGGESERHPARGRVPNGAREETRRAHGNLEIRLPRTRVISLVEKQLLPRHGFAFEHAGVVADALAFSAEECRLVEGKIAERLHGRVGNGHPVPPFRKENVEVPLAL